VTFKPARQAPVIVAAFVVALVCALRLWHVDFFERLERMTYDLRARTALHFPAPAATNLAFVAIDETSLHAVQSGDLGYSFGLLWPRQVYGRLVEELSAEGAQAVGFDVHFGELRRDHPPVQMADGSLMESDDFFALQMRLASNVIIAITPDIKPPNLFATNALALGDISTDKDPDGVLRRVSAFCVYPQWNRYIRYFARPNEYNLDLDDAQVLPGKIVITQIGTTNSITLSVDAQTNFSSTDLLGSPLPAGIPLRMPAFTNEIVWNMGVVLAARQLGLDLDKAEIDLPEGKIILHGNNGVERTIPVDSEGYFYVDWRLTDNDPHLYKKPIEFLLQQDEERLKGQTNALTNHFRDKLVIVGSAVQGNNLTDRGATPLEKDTLLVGKHWNVANSIITNRFIRRASEAEEFGLILFLGMLTAFFTLQIRPTILGSAAVLLLLVIYVAIAFYTYIQYRWWLPLVFPVAGAVFVQHLVLITYRAVFEEGEKRRIRAVFSKVVAPVVVNELLRAEKLSLGGARREVTVFFADVRGFTALTDEMQDTATKYVREHQLDAATAEAYFDESARETLKTVNTYLALVADTVIAHGGTLDKYIGDCVMAFWGAPLPHPQHATACVRAAIETQRGIYKLNQERLAENERRKNDMPEANGADRKLPILSLGGGINTGVVDVGLMGSEIGQGNYTVFGREVNLASRLESVSGSARIIIGETTYRHLLRDDPGLAATCKELDPVKVKGFQNEIKIYEVPWQTV
jgi:class 3 adenylate cyclase/CHASE2 domain-containing sensor protein